MKKQSVRAAMLGAPSAAVIGAALAVSAGAPALAQDVEAGDRVVVTGSRIARRDYQANSPLVTVDSSTFENTSTVGIETVLNQLPQFVPALFTQFNSQNVEPNPFQTPGASNVSLRGLGPTRTLVLVNGRRAVPLNAEMATDTNAIPSAAIQRVEIVSGGASAVYGADALAGVVNFILRDNYEGLTIDTQYGITEQGDNKEFRISALFGANLANGRGNVTLGVEHSTRGFASWNDRSWYVEQRNAPDIAAAGTEFWFSDSYFTTDFLNQPDQAVIDSLFPQAAPGAVGPFASFLVNRTPDGTGTVYSTTPGFVGFFGYADPTNPNSGLAGAYKYAGPLEQAEYPGQIWRKQLPNGEWVENQLANYISTPLERYSMFGSANFDLTDNITAFVNVTFARTRTNTLLQYSPANNAWGASIPYGTDIYADSVDGMGNTLAEYQAGGAYGLNCGPVGGCTNSEVFPVSAELAALLDSRPDSNAPWRLNRNMDYLPRRQTANRSTNFQIMAGFEGRLANNWFWDVAVSHGQADSLIQSVGFASLSAYLDVVTSPNYGRAGFWQENPSDGSTFAAGAASCTTGLPIMQDFIPSQDCIEALSRNMQETSLMRQTIVDGNITGDLFALPAGDVGFNIGASYRENNYEFRTDPLKSITSFSDQAIGIFPAGSTSGGIKAAEVYGELLVPIVRDLPFIQHLELELGGRYSDYDVTSGVFTYKALVDWGITDFARVRGGYNRANRAPNIGELFQARTTTAFGTAAAQGDPCSTNNYASLVTANPGTVPVGSGHSREGQNANENGAAGAAHALAICQAMMGSGGAAQYYANEPTVGNAATGVAGGTGQTATAGNPNLGSEKADTWTVGLVLSSPFEHALVRGLRLSVDYFQIKLEDYVTFRSPDDIYYDCLSMNTNATVAEALGSVACQAIQRQQTDGAAAFIDTFRVNGGGIKLSGVDVQLDWSAQLQDLGLGLPGGVALNVLATIPVEVKADFGTTAGLNHRGFASSPASGVSGSNYRYTVFSTLNYFTGPWNASLRWQHRPSLKGGSPANPNPNGNVGSYNVFALTGGYWVTDNVLIRAGVENLFNTKPPRSAGNPNATPFPLPGTYQQGGFYDVLGRRFFMGANVSF